jgi:hypothetical protein
MNTNDEIMANWEKVQAQKKKRTKNYIIVGIAIVVSIVGIISKVKKNEATKVFAIPPNTIPGLTLQDVCLNYQNKGFSIDKGDLSGYGMLCICKKNDAGITYNVQIFSIDGKTIQSITSIAQTDGSKNIEAAQDFILFSSTMPFDNNNPQEAQEGVIKNFNKTNSQFIIGKVIFEITAPAKFVRTLRLSADDDLNK